MTELPCKDCKFCKSGWHIFPFWRDYSFSKCHRPENYESSPVTGHLKYETVFCSTERKFDHRCGEEAKFFDPKPGKEIKYYGVVQKKNERREAMSRMWADLKKAGANVYELLGVYTLPGNPTDYSLKDLKQKYISGELTQVEKELKEKEIALKKEITENVRTEVKKDAATLIRKKYRGQKLIMEKPDNLAKMIEEMQ